MVGDKELSVTSLRRIEAAFRFAMHRPKFPHGLLDAVAIELPWSVLYRGNRDLPIRAWIRVARVHAITAILTEDAHLPGLGQKKKNKRTIGTLPTGSSCPSLPSRTQ